MKGLLEKEKIVQKEKVRQYKVIMYNDDITPFEYVILVLIKLFDKNPKEAIDLAKSIHSSGSGIAGIYAKEKAEEKLDMLEKENDSYGFELYATMEEM